MTPALTSAEPVPQAPPAPLTVVAPSEGVTHRPRKRRRATTQAPPLLVPPPHPTPSAVAQTDDPDSMSPHPRNDALPQPPVPARSAKDVRLPTVPSTASTVSPVLATAGLADSDSRSLSDSVNDVAPTSVQTAIMAPVIREDRPLVPSLVFSRTRAGGIIVDRDPKCSRPHVWGFCRGPHTESITVQRQLENSIQLEPPSRSTLESPQLVTPVIGQLLYSYLRVYIQAEYLNDGFQ